MIETSPYITAAVPYMTALLAGLFGSLHCLGMCGGINAAVSMQAASNNLGITLWWRLLGYQFGRLFTYTCLGAIVGLLGAEGAKLIEDYQGWMWLRVLAGFLMIVMGLYLASWWQGLVRIEQLGGVILWDKLRPLGQRLMKSKHAGQPIGLGMIWGFLPCGLVYSMLVWSFAAGGVAEGALLLLLFGLGTMPLMLATSVLSASSRAWLQQRFVRQTAGVLVIGFGVWTISASLVGRINVGLGCLPPA